MKKNMLDRNGNPLRGSARWLRQISLDGGIEEHDKKVAIEAFRGFLDATPEIATAISEIEAQKRRKTFKMVQ